MITLLAPQPGADTAAPVFSVKGSYGAKGDVKTVSDGAITTGTAALTSATANFAQTDVGKIVIVAGASTNVQPTGTTAVGSNQITALSSAASIQPGMLITGTGIPVGTIVRAVLATPAILVISQNATAANAGVVFTISGNISGTISAFTSSTSVTLSVNASTTVTNASVMWGSDDSAAVTQAVNALNAAGRGTLAFDGGDYFVGGGYNITASCTVCGIGVGASGFSTTVILKPNANQGLFSFSAKLCTVRDIGLDGNYLSQGGGGLTGINITGPYFRILNVFINAVYGDGVAFSGANAVGAHVSNLDIRTCQGYGINIGATCYDNDFVSVNIGTSGKSGMLVGAADTACAMLHSWGNGTLGSANEGSGVKFSGGVGACRFGTCYLENNYDRGVYGANAGNTGHTFNNTLIWQNRNQGMYMFSAKWISVTDCTIFENGQSGAAGQGSGGITNDSGTGWTVSGNTFYDNQTTKTQTWGYFEVNTADYNELTGNTWRAQDLKTGSTTIVGANNKIVGNSDGTAGGWTTVTYGASMASAGAPFYTNVQSKIMPDGSVRLRGVLVASGAVAGGATIATLAAGHRPTASVTVPVDAGAGIGNVTITNGGVVSFSLALVNTNQVPLDGITFSLDA